MKAIRNKSKYCLYRVSIYLFRCVNKDSHHGQRRYTSIQDNLILSKLFTYISHSWKVLKDSEKSENFKWDMRLYVWTWSKYRINLSFIDFWCKKFDFCAIPREDKSWMEAFKYKEKKGGISGLFSYKFGD